MSMMLTYWARVHSTTRRQEMSALTLTAQTTNCAWTAHDTKIRHGAHAMGIMSVRVIGHEIKLVVVVLERPFPFSARP